MLLVRAASWLRARSSSTGHASHPGHTAHTPHATHAEHLRENIVEVRTGAHPRFAGAVKRRHAVGIVDVTLVFIIEDIVGFLDRFEFGFCVFSLGFGDLVGVTGKSGLSQHIVRYEVAHIAAGSHLAICLSDFVFGCVSGNLQDLCRMLVVIFP